jgi:hypothetical protein
MAVVAVVDVVIGAAKAEVAPVPTTRMDPTMAAAAIMPALRGLIILFPLIGRGARCDGERDALAAFSPARPQP